MLKVHCEFCPNGVFDGTWKMAVYQGWKRLRCSLVVPEKKSEPFLTGHACPACVERVPKLIQFTLFPETAPELSANEDEPLGSLDQMETIHILRVLESTNWNKTQASEILGIERSTLDRKIKKYEIARSAGVT